jgi:hypothetical protein
MPWWETPRLRRAREEYAEEMCRFLGLPKKKCMDEAIEWERNLVKAFKD